MDGGETPFRAHPLSLQGQTGELTFQNGRKVLLRQIRNEDDCQIS